MEKNAGGPGLGFPSKLSIGSTMTWLGNAPALLDYASCARNMGRHVVCGAAIDG